MTTPCTSKVAPNAEMTALLVASGGEIDRLIADVLASEGWSVQRVEHSTGTLRSESQAIRFDYHRAGRRLAEDVELLCRIRSAGPHIRLII